MKRRARFNIRDYPNQPAGLLPLLGLVLMIAVVVGAVGSFFWITSQRSRPEPLPRFDELETVALQSRRVTVERMQRLYLFTVQVPSGEIQLRYEDEGPHADDVAQALTSGVAATAWVSTMSSTQGRPNYLLWQLTTADRTIV